MSAMQQDAAAAVNANQPMPDIRAPPSGVRFGSLLPLGVKGKAVTRKFFPNNGTSFASDSTNVIRIPLNGPYFLNAPDSYLRFQTYANIPAKSDAANLQVVRLDSSAHSFIQRLRIEGPDGSELERIEDYNVLHAMLLDFQSGDNHNHTSRIYEKVAGRNGNVVATMLPSGAAHRNSSRVLLQDDGSADQIYQTALELTSANSNYFEPANSNCVDMMNHSATGTAMTVGLKLVSGLLQNERYLPLLALKGAGLTLELTLADGVNVFYACESVPPSDASGSDLTYGDLAVTYNVENVEYIAQTVDFDEAFTSTFMSMIQANGLIQFHGVSYHSFVWTWSFAEGTEIIPIALRARSLKSILVGMRNQAFINKAAAFTIGHRMSGNISQYVFNIGGVRLPQAPVKIGKTREGLVEAYAEVVKAFSAFTNLSYAGRVSIGQYLDQGFAIAIDTEAYSQDTSLLESGMDTASQSLPVRLELTFGSATIEAFRSAGAISAANKDKICAAPATARADIYGMVDVIYSVSSDGLMTASD